MPSIQSQVGIGTVAPHNDAMLELSSTDRGFLLPRISLTAINDPAPLNAHIAGMTIYNIAVSGTGDNMVTPGFYVNDGTQWMRTGNDARSEARWVDQPGKVVLLHLSDGGTIRPVGAELVALDNGNIGIGTVNPSDKLTLDMKSSAGGVVVTGLPSYSKDINFANLAETGQGQINWKKANSTSVVSASIRSFGEGSSSRKGIAFLTGQNTNSQTSAVVQMRISPNGLIGMQNPGSAQYFPTAKFGIQANQRITGLNVEGMTISQGSGNLMSIIYPDDFAIKMTGVDEQFLLSSDKGKLELNGKNTEQGGIEFRTGSVTRMEVLGTNSGSGYDGIVVYDENSEITAKFTADGKVGINTTAPSEKLDIIGAIKVTDGGYIGVSDGATTPVPAGGAGTIIYTGNSFYGWLGSSWKKLDN